MAATCLLAVACDGDKPDGTESVEQDPRLVRPRANPTEFVGLTVQKEVDRESFLAFADPLFGEAAREGAGHTDLELQPGLFLSVADDPRTDEQRILTIEMMTSRGDPPERRTILQVPVSLAYGDVYVSTVRTALGHIVESEHGSRPFNLDYRVWSPNGGSLTIRLDWKDDRALLVLTLENPRTSLLPGEVNSPAFTGEPFETLGGTVWFELSRDQFDFFSTRAYGITNGADQNFEDFRLLPHDWLRLTVTPMPEMDMVDVAFEVATDDGRRIPFARSPASYLAGDQFRHSVFRMVDNMLEQEAAEPGSSTPFEVPFHYDDPDGGGVVKVIAKGEAGRFRIAYTVESPIRRLRDVEFVEYTAELGFAEPAQPPERDACIDLGSESADEGRFMATFDASPTVRESAELEHPLRGDVVGAIYRAEDVTIGGPVEGAEALGFFEFHDVDVRDAASLESYEIETTLPAGDYQLLGFLDVNGNREDTGNEPDPGDPVVLPIGDFTLECARQPVTVEFALLLPEGF